MTSGALSEAWGFVRGPKRVPEPAVLADARRTGWRHLTLDPERRTIAFDRPGVVLNLGSIGKGYAIDRAVDLIRPHWWPTSALVHGGWSSLYCARITAGLLRRPLGDRLAESVRCDQAARTVAVAESWVGHVGAAFQRFEANGRTYGHILDPLHCAPADGPASVTVLAPTAAEADALSTAFYLLEPEAVAAYLSDRPDVGAVFVQESKAKRSPRVLTFGLTEADFTRASRLIRRVRFQFRQRMTNFPVIDVFTVLTVAPTLVGILKRYEKKS